MEKRRTSHNKRNNQARQPRVGVEAAVVWGGALAIAGLITAFALKKRRPRRDRDKGSGTGSQVQGLPLILQSNPTENHSFTFHQIAKTEVIQTKSCESVSIRSLNSEEKAELCISNGEDENNPKITLYNNRNEDSEEITESCHQEILLSDDSAEQSVTSSDDCSNLEELKLIMNDSGEVLQLLKTNGVKNDEEEEDDVDNEENIKEKEQESCEVSGSSSMECNDEAVWAEETTEISSPESKSESTIADHLVEETDEETRINENRATRVENSMVILNEGETHGEVVNVMKDEDEWWRKGRARVQSVMAFLLLLLVFLYLLGYLFNVETLSGFK